MTAGRRRLPIGLLLIAPVVIGMGVYAFTGQDPVTPTPGAETPTATATPAAEAIATDTPVATPTDFVPAFPTSTPVPAHSGPLRPGVFVRVNVGEGDCLNARWSPGTIAEYSGVNACLPHGYEGLLVGDPLQVDGRWWWYMAGAGYVAEEFLVYVRDADLGPGGQPQAPQFAGLPGLIAFIRQDGAIWVMRPDGSEQRQLLAPRTEDGYSVWPDDLSWSPDGTMLSFNISRWFTDGRPPTSDLGIINVQGELVHAFPGTAGRFWSPDGTRIAVVSGVIPGEMGGGWKGTPGYIDIASGVLTSLPLPLVHENTWLPDLPSFNHDGTLVAVSYQWYGGEETNEAGFVIYTADGAEVQRVVSPEGEYITAPMWSPVANLLVMEHSTVGVEARTEQSYRVWDVSAASFVAAAAVPAWSPNRGGGCGAGADMARASWSRDGSRFTFGFMYGEAGANGLWTYELASGAMTLLPIAGTYNAAAGPGTMAVFSDGTHIFAGDTGGSYPTLITDGHSPVWSSGQ